MAPRDAQAMGLLGMAALVRTSVPIRSRSFMGEILDSELA